MIVIQSSVCFINILFKNIHCETPGVGKNNLDSIRIECDFQLFLMNFQQFVGQLIPLFPSICYVISNLKWKKFSGKNTS